VPDDAKEGADAKADSGDDEDPSAAGDHKEEGDDQDAADD
jgi:hypothetical protein